MFNQFQNQMRPQVNSYFVSSPYELSGINYMPNTYYMGLNFEKGEIYIKHMKNDGLVESTIYKLDTHEDEKSLAERLSEVEKALKELKSETKDARAINKKPDQRNA